MHLLKQSTAATLRVGPFMDATDAVTPETGITLGAADQAEALKHSGATVDISAATWAAITGCDGWYDLSLTTSHTDTLGMLTIVVQDSSVCGPVFVRAMVLPAMIYDSLVAGTDRLDANVTHVSDTAQTARDIGASVLLSSGTGTGQVVLTSGIVSADTTKWSGTAVPTPDTAGYPKVTVKVGTGTGELSLSSGAVKIQTGLKKNQALLNFPFQMTDSTNHNPATGLTVSVSVSLDGGASFTSVGTATEMANGWYQIDLTAGNMNGDTVAFKAIATGADDLGITIVTEP